MSDQVINAIGSNLTNQGYTVRLASLPSVKEWDTLPCVLISPKSRPVLSWHAFGRRNQKQTYILVYVANSGTNSTLNDLSYEFKQYVITNFMGLAPEFDSVDGVWQSRVIDYDDYDTNLLPIGYSYSAIHVEIDRILDLGDD